MQETLKDLPLIKLMGISTRTNNEDEMNIETAKITSTIQQYYQAATSAEILHRKKPGTLYCVYTDYESDFTGDYTYFVGEEVTSFDGQPETFKQLTIEAQLYTIFTPQPGSMPKVVIDAWQSIWKMTPEDFGGKRAYVADFEVYDMLASTPDNMTVNIHIGLER